MFKLFKTMRWFLVIGYFLISFCQLSVAEEYLPVKTMPIEKKTVYPVITAFGSLEKNPQLLYFEISGYLTKLLVDEGDSIKKGQLLAQLDTVLIDNQKAQVQLAIKHFKKKLARAKKLQHRNVLAKDELENTEYNYSAKLLEAKRIKEERKKHFIFAPAKGKILKRFLDFASPVDPTIPIFMMKSAKQPWLVTAHLTESEVNTIKEGNIAKVSFNGLPQKVFTGKVQTIADSTEEKDGMLEVEIALNQATPLLRAGTKAIVHIETAPQSGYLVPLNVLFRIKKDNLATIFVVDKENKIAKKLDVEFYLIKGTDAVVSSDLSKYGALIIAGQHNLRDGSLIQVIQE